MFKLFSKQSKPDFSSPVGEGQNPLTCVQEKATLMWAGVKIQPIERRELMEMGPAEEGHRWAGHWVPGDPP